MLFDSCFHIFQILFLRFLLRNLFLIGLLSPIFTVLRVGPYYLLLICWIEIVLSMILQYFPIIEDTTSSRCLLLPLFPILSTLLNLLLQYIGIFASIIDIFQDKWAIEICQWRLIVSSHECLLHRVRVLIFQGVRLARRWSGRMRLGRMWTRGRGLIFKGVGIKRMRRVGIYFFNATFLNS